MDLSRIITDKNFAAKTVWVVYTLCTVIMGAMTYFNGWSMWIIAELCIHLAIITTLTFWQKISVQLQSTFMTIFSFANIFMCGIAEKSIYQSLAVFLGAGILIAVYRSERLLTLYSALIALAIIFHLAIFKSIKLDSSAHITDFIVRVSVTFTALILLMILVRGINSSGEAMRKSVEDSRKAERYKSDFLANMSHEIRTPMNAIVGMCELTLRENDLSPTVRENCFNIQTSGRSLLAIINDILDFSKIESGQMELVNEEFNIASLINDVINMSEARRGTKDIEILVNADPNIPRGLVGDEMRIRQVIVNLMTNAIKFTHSGSVTLSASYTVQDYGINLMFSVADTGIGITEENLEKLFISFRQVDTRKNRAVEGTGLGLAISKRLIGYMGGFISVNSEYGKGSEFRFVIPLKVSEDRPFAAIKQGSEVHAAACLGENGCADKQVQIFLEAGKRLGTDFVCVKNTDELKKLLSEKKLTHIFVCGEEYFANEEFFGEVSGNTQVFVIQDRVSAARLPEGITCVYKPFYIIPAVSALNQENMVLNLNERRSSDIRFTAPKARILVVDDNAINLKVATGLMQPYKMQVMTAQSGQGAINMLRSKDIDIVFMDHMMPGMDGVEATTVIRQQEGEYYRKLPIVALTANVANGAREMFMESGFSDFLAKPLELSALDRVLRNNLPKEYIQPLSEDPYTKEDRRKAHASPPSENPTLLNTEKGISYMGGDENSYKEILALYAEKSEKKIQQIGELFDKDDLKNYVIEVHALKSTSLNIGAVGLSELAKELETAGRAGNFAVIKKKNGELLALYRDVSEAARKYLAETGGVPEPEQPAEENTELAEISAELLTEYIERAKAACESFDGDDAAEIAAETERYSFGGEPLREYFGKSAKLAEDFEYEDAAKVIAELESKMKG